jgi:glycosyltransferase involved in cell wall biosynthesis
MERILVSVVMPVFNAERFVGQAIESILTQTYRNLEFLILNDGSTDRTEEIVKSFHDQRIRYFRSESNLGLVSQLNSGLANTSGKYIVRMDADDIARPNRIERQVLFMENHPEIGVSGSNVVSFNTHKKFLKSVLPEGHDEICTHFLFGNSIYHPSIIIRRSVLLAHGVQYTKGTDTSEDYVLYVDLHEKTKLANLQEVLLNYRLHDANVSKTNRTGQQQIIDAKRRLYVLKFLQGVDSSTADRLVEHHLLICRKPLASTQDVSDLMSWLMFLKSVNDRNKSFGTRSFNRGVAHFLYRKFIADGKADFRTLVTWWFKQGVPFSALPSLYKVLFIVRCLYRFSK